VARTPRPPGTPHGILDVMTKVQMQFRLERALDDAAMAHISDAYSIYGIQKIRVAPAQDRLMVEYDATRLRPAEVHAALASAGIPVAPE